MLLSTRDRGVPYGLMRIMWSARTRLPRESGPLERCGVLMGVALPGLLVVERAVEVGNRHPEPEAYFAMSRSDVEDATVHLPGEVVGHWHTHDEPLPASEADISGCGDLVGLALHPESGFSSWYDRHGRLEVETPMPWPVLVN